MIYAISDLHGYPLEKLRRLLGKAGFSDEDYLFILGDVIDRNGDGGVEVLEWLLYQPNAELILGNHEAMLLSCAFVFEEITEKSLAALTQEQLDLLYNYQQNGGGVTLAALAELRKRSPETVGDILDYLRDAPLYETLSIGKRDFLLVHAGLGHFEKSKKLSDYSPDDFIWANPDPTTEYFDDVLTVFGHTPTISFDPKLAGRLHRTRTWLDIDAGAGFGQEPVLLRLDDMAEFSLRAEDTADA